MSALLYTAIGGTALLASIAIVAAMARDTVDHLTPTGYDPAPAGEDERTIRIHPNREPF